jgi:hypothetical protein
VKYRLLSKEQFEELHKEFATFLAAQEIDESTWKVIKETEPRKVIQQLENFSDLVWEEVLSKTKYLEHFSADSLNLFHCMSESINRIVVRVEKEGINLQEKEGFDWFINNSNDSSVQYFKGEKPYTLSRSEELFKLIEQGATLADAKLFNGISKLLNSKAS